MDSQLVLPGAPPPPRPKMSQYDTPSELARRMVDWADCLGLRVLEPSAGLGGIARELRDAGARVSCVEVDSNRVAWLHGQGFSACAHDFLSLTPHGYDLVVGNPPYEDGQDTEHLLHALKFAPRVVMLLPLGMLDGVDRHKRLWSHHTLSRLAILVRRFKAPGSEMSGQRPFAVFEVLRGKHDVATRVEWW